MYATQQFMTNAFGERELIQLTDRDGDTQAIVVAVLESALQSATAVINGYLQSRYSLPLQVVPTILEQQCADIARYYLYDNQVPEVVKARYDAAIKWLEAVATGKMNIGPDESGATLPSNNFATIESAGSVFARNKSKGFI